jgi:hypothetical protein
MSDTPRTDAESKRLKADECWVQPVRANFARALERELTAAQAKVKRLSDVAEVRKLALDAQTSELCKLAADNEALRETWRINSDAFAAKEAEVEALRADAERYRYLRSRQALEVLTGRGPSAGVWCDMENEMGTLVLVTGNDLDAEVDAALAKEKA